MGRIPGITTIALISLILLAIAGCGGDSSSDKESTTTSPPKTTTESGVETTTERSTTTSSKGSRVAVANTSKYGKMVTDGKGLTLYLFTREKSYKSECYDECAKEWPPFLTGGKPAAKSGIKSDLLGTTKRNDGSLQVTYKGHPLYYYKGESEAGQIFCQAVESFGGIWYIVDPDGNQITTT